MRIVVRGVGAVVALVVALAVSGCASSPPRPSPTPSPSATPLFQSDEEALAAAEEAYAAYLSVSDQILIDGGANPERLLDVATQEVLDNELEGFQQAQSNGHRSTGGSAFDTMHLQQSQAIPQSAVSNVFVYVCDDISAVDFVDSEGRSVVSPDRPDRFPVVVSFTPNDDRRAELKVSSIEEWTGEDFCADPNG